MTQPHIIIAGAGFGGLAASRELHDFGNVTVIDPRSDFEFLPNIHELISGHKEPQDLRLNSKQIVEDHAQTFLKDTLSGIDKENRMAFTASGKTIPYDCCILAIGGVDNKRGVEGVAQHALGFKSVRQCAQIHARLQELESQKQTYRVVIIGGGVEGVEALGELLRGFSKKKHIHISLVEAGAYLLPQSSPKISKEIVRLCEDLPVDFHFSTKATRIEAGKVALDNGKELKSDLTIWTGGVSANPLIQQMGFVAEGKSWPQVNHQLQSLGNDRIFIIGDNVEIAGEGEQAYHALEMGKIAAENARSILSGGNLSSFHPPNYPSVCAFGNLSCFVTFNGWMMAGLPLSSLKESIFQLNMASFQKPWEESQNLIDTVSRLLRGYAGLGISNLFSPLSFFDQYHIRLL